MLPTYLYKITYVLLNNNHLYISKISFSSGNCVLPFQTQLHFFKHSVVCSLLSRPTYVYFFRGHSISRSVYFRNLLRILPSFSYISVKLSKIIKKFAQLFVQLAASGTMAAADTTYVFCENSVRSWRKRAVLFWL